MKKILCLILILACSLTLFACGEDETCTAHTDANGDKKCDTCSADMPATPCTEHVDANLDRKCDTCGADMPPCTEHVDADNNFACDVCGTVVVDEALVKVLASITSSKPTEIVTRSNATVNATGRTLSGYYYTAVTADGFTFDYEYQLMKAPSFGSDDNPVETVEGQIIYRNGSYSEDGGETWGTGAPNVDYMNMKLNITPEDLGAYEIYGNTLTAAVSAEKLNKMFGINISAETVNVEIVTVDSFLHKIKFSYETGNMSVAVETSYAYSPVA